MRRYKGGSGSWLSGVCCSVFGMWTCYASRLCVTIIVKLKLEKSNLLFFIESHFLTYIAFICHRGDWRCCWQVATISRPVQTNHENPWRSSGLPESKWQVPLSPQTRPMEDQQCCKQARSYERPKWKWMYWIKLDLGILGWRMEERRY